MVLFGESVRRDALCLTPSADCAKSPRLDAAAPNRIGFQKAFTTASCTELASVALFSGRGVTTPPEALAAAPLVWDYAKARGYHTAYLTSQNLLFQGSDRFLRGTAIDTNNYWEMAYWAAHHVFGQYFGVVLPTPVSDTCALEVAEGVFSDPPSYTVYRLDCGFERIGELTFESVTSEEL